MYVFSILLIVLSNIMYNICTKSIPEKASPFLSLFVTYCIGAGITLLTYVSYDQASKSLVQSLEEVNWASIALGVSIVGLEFGYIMAYRAGWNISEGSLVANILLAIMLIPIGIFVYKEQFGMYKILGVAFCIIGLIFINKK